MAKQYKIFICGGDYTNLQAREDCPDSLHDWPLPDGYVEASEVAAARLRERWSNRKCRRCGLYGWAPCGKRPESTHPVHVPFPSAKEEPAPPPAKTIVLPMENE